MGFGSRGTAENDSWFIFLLISRLNADSGHALAESAVLDKDLLQAVELVVEQIGCLVDLADGDIGYDFGGTSLHKFTENLKSQRSGHAQFPDVPGLAALLVPDGKVANPQKIPVVLQQFLQTRTGDIGEFDFHFF